LQILNTERLKLRWFSEADAPFIRRLLNEPSWIRNIGDRQIRSDDDALSYIRNRLIPNYWRHGFGFWAVERAADGALIGMCGLTQRESLPEPDIGYALLPEHWGQGYAREAAAACLRYARDVLGLRRLLAITAPHNQPSMALLASIGLKPGEPPMLKGDEGESCLFEWQAEPQAAPGDVQAIDAVIASFFAAFCTLGAALPPVAAIPHWCLPEARIHRRGSEGTLSMDLHGFIAPRAELLQCGRLIEFDEQETAQQTEIDGGVAQRWSHYRKVGILDGQRFEGGGRKGFQLVRTPRGWKIASLLWEDEADV
jgi:RimJ/RimL family protein N-acetyltransferase